MLEPRRWLLLAFLTVAMFFCYAHRGTLPVAAPFLMKELGLNHALMGVLLSAFFWSYSLAQVPAGWLLDRYGLGRVYAAGFLLWTIAVAMTGLATSLTSLIFARMLLGLGQGVPFPASARAAANWFPAGERGGVIGIYLAGSRIGQAAIAAAGPLVLVLGWRNLFLISGALGVLWLIPWMLTMRWWDRVPVDAAAKAGPRPSLRDAIELMRDRRIAGIFLGFFAYDYVWFLFLTWMPGYLMLERKFTAREMSIYSSVPMLVVSLVIVLAGLAGDALVRAGWNEVTARKVLITAGLLIACLIVPAGIVKDNFASAWLLSASICGLGMVSPNSWALTQAVCEKRMVGTASGIQNFGGNLGGVLAPVLTGLIAHQTGSFALAFLVAGVLMLGGIACYWWLIPSNPAPRAS
jgi:ACS family D-galactonate transporter-like MFS transporter